VQKRISIHTYIVSHIYIDVKCFQCPLTIHEGTLQDAYIGRTVSMFLTQPNAQQTTAQHLEQSSLMARQRRRYKTTRPRACCFVVSDTPSSLFFVFLAHFYPHTACSTSNNLCCLVNIVCIEIFHLLFSNLFYLVHGKCTSL